MLDTASGLTTSCEVTDVDRDDAASAFGEVRVLEACPPVLSAGRAVDAKSIFGWHEVDTPILINADRLVLPLDVYEYVPHLSAAVQPLTGVASRLIDDYLEAGRLLTIAIKEETAKRTVAVAALEKKNSSTAAESSTPSPLEMKENPSTADEPSVQQQQEKKNSSDAAAPSESSPKLSRPHAPRRTSLDLHQLAHFPAVADCEVCVWSRSKSSPHRVALFRPLNAGARS